MIPTYCILYLIVDGALPTPALGGRFQALLMPLLRVSPFAPGRWKSQSLMVSPGAGLSCWNSARTSGLKTTRKQQKKQKKNYIYTFYYIKKKNKTGPRTRMHITFSYVDI